MSVTTNIFSTYVHKIHNNHCRYDASLLYIAADSSLSGWEIRVVLP